MTTKRSEGTGTATLWKPLQYDEAPSRLENTVNWEGVEVATITYASYELHEYFANGLEQAGIYIFYNSTGDMIATCSKSVVSVSTAASTIDGSV